MSALPAFVHDPLISATYASHLLDLLEARGLPRAAVVAQCHIAPAWLEQDDYRLAPIHFLRIVSMAHEAGAAEGLGMAFGLALLPTSHGVLGMALMACPTLRDAMQLALRYTALRSGIVHPRYFEEGDTGVLQFDQLERLGPYKAPMFEALSCIVFRTASFLAGDTREGTEIWMTHAEPAHFGQWRSQLPRVRFGMPVNQIRFLLSMLDRAVAMASPPVARAAASQLEAELSVLGTVVSTATRVRGLLARVRDDFPSLETVADKLCMSGSTLKRRLQQEGCSFQALLDEVRCTRALHYLDHTQMSVEQVAQALGYSDPANFSRAFRKWTGVSPSAWRSGQREPSAVREA
ncbi:MAG: AraC family transcriptional regulator ligand-binding domain-containing protein [Moraxellaceae bacterium]